MMMADIAWWFGWSMSDIENMFFDELQTWLAQANRQIKEGYAKATI